MFWCLKYFISGSREGAAKKKKKKRNASMSYHKVAGTYVVAIFASQGYSVDFVPYVCKEQSGHSEDVYILDIQPYYQTSG